MRQGGLQLLVEGLLGLGQSSTVIMWEDAPGKWLVPDVQEPILSVLWCWVGDLSTPPGKLGHGALSQLARVCPTQEAPVRARPESHRRMAFLQLFSTRRSPKKTMELKVQHKS